MEIQTQDASLVPLLSNKAEMLTRVRMSAMKWWSRIAPYLLKIKSQFSCIYHQKNKPPQTVKFKKKPSLIDDIQS